MKKIQFWILAVMPLLFISCTYDYRMVWNDEFDTDGSPDTLKWDFNIGGHGFGNNEWQYYTDSPENARIQDGKLVITAREEKFEESNYTSARMTTKSTGGHWKYGKVEASMKLPYGQGIWPAFWMLGSNIGDVGWPGCGEIDIMEMIGGEGRENGTHGTLHWKNADGRHAKNGSKSILEEGIYADKFHLFSIEWDAEQITWFVDNTPFHSLEITSGEFSAFHKEFYILLNLAVGGNWPGYPDSTTVFPQTMEVDFVRVYQK